MVDYDAVDVDSIVKYIAAVYNEHWDRVYVILLNTLLTQFNPNLDRTDQTEDPMKQFYARGPGPATITHYKRQ